MLGDALPGAVHAVSVTARWTIERPDGSKASGSTLLVLRRASEAWSIVSDASM